MLVSREPTFVRYWASPMGAREAEQFASRARFVVETLGGSIEAGSVSLPKGELAGVLAIFPEGIDPRRVLSLKGFPWVEVPQPLVD